MIVMWLFLAVPWVSLQFVLVVFPDHTHYFGVCFVIHERLHVASEAFISLEDDNSYFEQMVRYILQNFS